LPFLAKVGTYFLAMVTSIDNKAGSVYVRKVHIWNTGETKDSPVKDDDENESNKNSQANYNTCNYSNVSISRLRRRQFGTWC